MAQPYTVMLPGGGSMTVNASSPDAARANAGQNSSATVIAGGNQTISGSRTDSNGNVVGTTTINPNAYIGAGELGRAPNSGGVGSVSYGVAADGKSLGQQDVATQNMFIQAYGADQAAQGWAVEHNVLLGVAPGATPGSVSPNNSAPTNQQPNPTQAVAAVKQADAATNPTSAANALTGNANSPWSVSAPGGGSISGTGTAPTQLTQAVTDYYNALQTGNKAAADEAIKEFNQGYDLTVSGTTGTFNGSPTQAALKQAADIAYQQAGLTGTFNGAPTLAAEKQASDLAQQNYQQGITTAGVTGTYNGQQTLASQQMGLDALKANAAMQNDPFRQQQYQYGLSAGGYSNAIDAMNGTTGFATSQGGMGPSAAGTNTLAYLGNQISQYDPSHMAAFYANTMGQAGGTPQTQAPYSASSTGYVNGAPTQTAQQLLALNPTLADPAYQKALQAQRGYVFWQGENLGADGMPTSAGPQPAGTTGSASNTAGNAYTMGGSLLGSGTSTYNASLNALPNSANQIVGANYLKADPATQNFITSGMSAKTGLDQATIDQQIKNTMPKFNAPSFGLSTV